MDAATKGGRPAARRAQTRGPANAEAILAAAHKLVIERGEGFTTQDVIREADVALQTFYRHFGSKDQLLIAVIADLTSAHCTGLADRAKGIDDPVERLRFYVMETLSPLVEHPAAAGSQFMAAQHWRLMQHYPTEFGAATRAFSDLVQVELDAAQASGQLRPSDTKFDAWAINKLVISTFHHYAFADDETLAEADGLAVAENVWRFCLAAVGGAELSDETGRRRPLSRGARRRS